MHKFPSRVRPAPDAQFPDFSERSIDLVEDDTPHRLKLLLPATAEVDHLLQQRANSAREAEAKAAEDRARRLEAQTAERGHKKSSDDPGFAIPSRQDKERLAALDARAQMQLDYERTRDQLMAAEVSDDRLVPVYKWDATLRLIEDRKTSPDRDLRDRDKELFGQLQKLGAFRRVCSDPQMEIALASLSLLRASQPHFAPVLDFIAARVRLAHELHEPMRIAPVLLAGPPGVGKTHFTLELARALERPVHRHSFDTPHTGSALMGSDRNWANTRTGRIFEAVCLSDRADPVFLLDELDKAIEHAHGANPLAPLHGLLEPVTAAAVTDISVGIEFDARHVFFMATANDLDRVPPPILSRFQVFRIEPPTAQQAIELAQAVGVSVHLRYSGFEAPPKRLITSLAHLTPREQIQALEHAHAQAVVNGRKHLVHQDLPDHLRQDEGEPSAGHFLH